MTTRDGERERFGEMTIEGWAAIGRVLNYGARTVRGKKGSAK